MAGQGAVGWAGNKAPSPACQPPGSAASASGSRPPPPGGVCRVGAAAWKRGGRFSSSDARPQSPGNRGINCSLLIEADIGIPGTRAVPSQAPHLGRRRARVQPAQLPGAAPLWADREVLPRGSGPGLSDFSRRRGGQHQGAISWAAGCRRRWTTSPRVKAGARPKVHQKAPSDPRPPGSGRPMGASWFR